MSVIYYSRNSGLTTEFTETTKKEIFTAEGAEYAERGKMFFKIDEFAKSRHSGGAAGMTVPWFYWSIYKYIKIAFTLFSVTSASSAVKMFLLFPALPVLALILSY